MRIVLTGGSGYIGQRLVKLALADSHRIVSASRTPLAGVQEWLHFDLRQPSVRTLPQDLDAVIHLAADTSGGKTDEETEVAAARAILSAADAAGARFVFVSSQAARKDAPTSYGRIKWHIEQDVLSAGGVVVRPGQIYGGQERGLFGVLVDLVRRLPVLPAFIPAPLVQPIHVDDCAAGLLRLAELKNVRSDVYCLASPEPVSFTKFLRSIARYRVRRRRYFVPVPVVLIRLFVNVIGEQRAATSGLYRLISLFDLPLMDTQDDLQVIGLELRSLHSGMHRGGCDRRRRLIQEAVTILAYLLKERPAPGIVRRYVRMIEKLRHGTPLDLPRWLARWPAGMALLDSNSAAGRLPAAAELAWRIDAATVISEASVQGASRFLGPAQRPAGHFTTLLRIAVVIAAEISWRLFHFIVPSRFLRAGREG